MILVGGGTFYYANMYHVEWENCERFSWVFKDSAWSNIDKDLCLGNVGKNDVHKGYVYKRKYYVEIWEFFNLHDANLSDVPFNTDIVLDKVEIQRGEIIQKDVFPCPQITVKFRPYFNKMNINFNVGSKIIKTLNAPKYKGFYGNTSRITLTNEKDENEVIFDFHQEDTTIFLAVKNFSRFYLIIVNSKEKFDDSILNIFNLE